MMAQRATQRGTARARTIDQLIDLEQLDIPSHRDLAACIGLVPGDSENTYRQIRNAGRAAILSIRQRWSINVRTYQMVKDRDLTPFDADAIRNILREQCPVTLPLHYQGIKAWDTFCDRWGLALLRRDGEDWRTYRDRLTDCRTVGYKVASFIALLLYPTIADVAVVDSWLTIALGIPFPDRKRTYYLAEDLLRHKLTTLGYTGPLGLGVWAIWDWTQPKQVARDHSPLCCH